MRHQLASVSASLVLITVTCGGTAQRNCWDGATFLTDSCTTLMSPTTISVGGVTFDARTTTAFGGGPLPGIVIGACPNPCGDASGANAATPRSDRAVWLQIDLSFGLAAPHAGTFEIGAVVGELNDGGVGPLDNTAQAEIVDVPQGGTLSASAAKQSAMAGTVNVGTFDGSHAAGQYDLTFSDGAHVVGAFGTTFCSGHCAP